MNVEESGTEVVKEALDEILTFCIEACAERQAATEGSPEWHKRTGEILAYGKMTHALAKLERCDTLPAARA
jgi:hypothetical protein